MTNEELEKRYIWNGDIYGSLMKGNIALNKGFVERQTQNNRVIQQMILDSNDEFIDRLFESNNWRGAIIAGCLIGFKNKKNYISLIGERLLIQCGGATAYCYALAKFSNPDSVNYLTRYLDKYLKFEKYPEEKFQDWAFSALRWIDKENKSNFSSQYLEENGLWNKFVNFEFKTKTPWKLSEFKRWGNLNSADLRFELMMKYYRVNFENIGKAADNKL